MSAGRTVRLVAGLALLLAGLPTPAVGATAPESPRPSLLDPAVFEAHGHLKLFLSGRRFAGDDLVAASGQDLADLALDTRLNLEAHPGRWRLVTQVELIGAQGDSLQLLRDPEIGPLVAQVLAVPSTDTPRSWLDLDHTFTDSGRRRLVGRLDRLSVGYTGDRLVLRLGRQALSWGNGMVFGVLDLFDPFPPTATDTEYKPGTDMLWGQWLFASGDDLQALVVPRRDPGSGDLARDESSWAAQWHHYAKSLELALMAAEHYGDRVIGLGASRDLLGGVARLDLTLTRAEGGSDVTSALINLDHSWIWRGRSVYGFAELYRNGFGARRPADVGSLDPALLARLERGELFAVGRDEAALGARIELTALSSLEPTLIADVHDASGLALVRLRHELGDELRLDVGLQLPWGGRGTEYGGLLATPEGEPPRYLSSGSWLWLRLSRYF